MLAAGINSIVAEFMRIYRAHISIKVNVLLAVQFSVGVTKNLDPISGHQI